MGTPKGHTFWGRTIRTPYSTVSLPLGETYFIVSDDTTTMIDIEKFLSIIFAILSAAMVAFLSYLILRITAFQAKKSHVGT